MTGLRGTVRKDIKQPCPECGQMLRPCNMERHVQARHPDAPALEEFREAKIRDILRGRE